MANTYPLSQVAKELNKMMAEMFTEYSEELQEKADKVTADVAQDFANQLATVTPRSDSDTEHLADTVTVTTKDEKSLGKKTKVRYVHYKKFQLAHLLEFGWTTKNGRRIERTPFVRPLFDNNKEKYYNMYKEAVKK